MTYLFWVTKHIKYDAHSLKWAFQENLYIYIYDIKLNMSDKSTNKASWYHNLLIWGRQTHQIYDAHDVHSLKWTFQEKIQI